MTVSFTRNYWPDPVWSLNSGVELAVDPSSLSLTSLETCQGFDDFIRTTVVPAVNSFSVTKFDSNFNCHSSNPGHIPRSLSCRARFHLCTGIFFDYKQYCHMFFKPGQPWLSESWQSQRHGSTCWSDGLLDFSSLWKKREEESKTV